mmetsp:Transcript_17220/g.25308  ORF Transcript_17220/g.25308 Transcript_17220/m.25308 type:complete len:82 (+) Transcript_17220:121-366(+)
MRRKETNDAAAGKGVGNLQRAFAGNAAAAPASGAGSDVASFVALSAAKYAADAALHEAGQPASAQAAGVSEHGAELKMQLQ